MEVLVIILIVFCFGAAVGSFLNVVVDRSESKEKFVLGRSHCDSCRKPLKIVDLVPILSFLILRGKCRYCKKKLSFYYPLTEIITGILFVITLNLFPFFGSILTTDLRTIATGVILISIISTLIVIFFTDLKFGIIPFNIVILSFVFSVTLHLLFPIDISFVNYFLSGTGLSLFFLSIFLVTRGKGMGFGDVVYAFLMGFILGYPKVILGFYIAVLSGAIIPIIVLSIKKKKIRGASIPFGPFLVAGTIISLFWGNILTEKILSYLLR